MLRRSTVLLVIFLMLLVANTATSQSLTENGSEKVSPPVFSHSGGWHEQNFELVLATSEANGTIHFTLDGSEPTEKSPVYKNPLKIRNRTLEPNNLSLIVTGLDSDIRPRENVYKGTVVRAIVISPQGQSGIATHTYFVDPKMHTRYTFPVISIATDNKGLFDYEEGIYVPGKIYDDNFDEAIDPWHREANYSQRGKEWERPAHIEFFETDGTVAFAHNIGIRIHGGASRSNPIKSLRLYARREYDDEHNYMRHEVFPGLMQAGSNQPLERFKRLLLRSSGNDWQSTMLRDMMMQSLVDHLSFDTQAGRPAVVFINGEYWGIHNIRERYDDRYLQNHYGVSTDDVVILESDAELDEGEPGDEQHYLDMLEYLREHDVADQEHYDYIQTQMDVENYIEYQISNIYFGNRDWPQSNIRFWRVKTDEYQEGAGYLDGRWRWMLFDTDFGFGLYLGRDPYRHATLEMATETGGEDDWSTFLLRTLLTNDQFRTLFVNSFADHLNSTFSSQRVVSHIDDFEKLYMPEIGEHINRWTWPMSSRGWRDTMDAFRDFGRRRANYMFSHIADQFNLDTFALTIENDQTQGYVQVNSILIAPETVGIADNPYPFRGTYFKGVPITITAIPSEGYSFVGWEGVEAESTISADLTVALTKSTVIRPIFSKDN